VYVPYPGQCSRDASADLGLHHPHGIGIGLEHAVDDDDMEVGMLVQRGTEPVDERHGPGACLGTAAKAAAQVLLDCIQQNAQGTVESFAVVLKVIA